MLREELLNSGDTNAYSAASVNSSSGLLHGWGYRHLVIFWLTFIAYAVLRATRQSFANIKLYMEDDYHCTNSFLGSLDTTFMIVYAAGQYLSGYIGERFDAVAVFSLGLVLTGVSVLLFGSLHSWGVRCDNHNWEILFFYFLWIFNGLAQSLAFPTSVKVMGNWFDKGNTGFVFGLWSANSSIGNVIGTAIVNYVGDQSWGSITWMFYFPSFVLFIVAVFLFAFVTEAPKLEQRGRHTSLQSQKKIEEAEEKSPISYGEAFRITKVIIYSLAYACFKSVNYTMFFWLPLMLKQKSSLNFSNGSSNRISMLYNLGGVLGGWICGIVADRLGKLAPPTTILGFFSIIPIFALSLPDMSETQICILIFAAGVLLGGPSNLISSAIIADIGRSKKLSGNKESISMVAGIINGTASAGAALTQGFIGYFSDYFGWTNCLWLLSAFAIIGSSLITPTAIRELRELKKK